MRVSVTDRCNMRCVYCIPRGGVELKRHEEIISFEETVRLAEIFLSLGIKNIRLTGGEPLVRKGLLNLVDSLVKIDGIEKVMLTTNGILLPFYANALKNAGLDGINISLDTLKKDTFKYITGSDNIESVFRGIESAKNERLEPIKLNTVIMRGINDSEIPDFVEFALSRGIVLRFIEFMKVTPLWKKEYYVPIEEIKDTLCKRFRLKRTGVSNTGPAEYYAIDGESEVGFIKTDETNCKSCNRLRLSSTGDLRICLYEKNGISLRELVRGGSSDEKIKDIILRRMTGKPACDYRSYEGASSYMSKVGG